MNSHNHNCACVGCSPVNYPLHDGSTLTTLQQQVERLLETVSPKSPEKAFCDGPCDDLHLSGRLAWFAPTAQFLCEDCLRDAKRKWEIVLKHDQGSVEHERSS